MPLNLASLQSGLEAVAKTPGATAADCAQAWANAVGGYFVGVTPPSTTVAAAQTTLAGALAAAFTSTPYTAVIASMEAAFKAAAATIGLGQAGWTPVPPATDVGFATLFAPPLPQTHADAAQKLASAIDVWARTGTSTLIAPPATTTPWS